MWCDLDNIHCLRDAIWSIGLLILITWTATNWGRNFYSNWTCSIYTQSWICLNTKISSNPYQLNDKGCSWTDPCCGEERLAVLRTNQKWSSQQRISKKVCTYFTKEWTVVWAELGTWNTDLDVGVWVSYTSAGLTINLFTW